MIINKIIIDNKYAEFDSKTLIKSSKNSVGKTTFLRIILFALGWQIPSTKNMKFNNLKIQIFFESKGDNYHFIREENLLSIYKNNKYIELIDINNEPNKSLTLFIPSDNIDLINNALGTFYFDQEKGWTLLNRGRVTASKYPNSYFKIEDFLAGLMENDRSDLLIQKDINDRKIKGYKLLNQALEYKEEINDSYLDWSSFDELNDQQRLIKLDINKLKSQINTLEKSKRNNKAFIEMIDNLGLQIRVGSSLVAVNKNNLDFNSFNELQSFIETRILILKQNLSKLSKQKKSIETRLQKQQTLFNVSSQLNRFNKAINQLNLDSSTVETIINQLKKDNKRINKLLNQPLRSGEYTQKLYENFIEFAEFLNIDKNVKEKNIIFTNKLNGYSGAILHLLVFSFRLACLKLLQEKTNQLYPIIIDSPFNGETTDENVVLMYKLLKEYFPNNQVITATVRNLDTTLIKCDFRFNRIIEFKNTMMNSLDYISNSNNI
ncbi:hypothetical protein [Limosilactobacillus mucosae]|uniref:hypothetical protein n=1 Tax=Limosilactobacillus mucosae TaxID=97478 RepID=UPI0022DEEA8A|nr:hypothetical protein [Limosilactobacillus mucosae]